MHHWICHGVWASLAVAAGLFGSAHAKDMGSLVGYWQTERGAAPNVWVEFRADGTATIGEDDGQPMTVTWTADFEDPPVRLELGMNGAVRRAIVEFLDDDRVRMTEPRSTYPDSFDTVSYMVFARAAEGPAADPISPDPISPDPTSPDDAFPLTQEMLVGSWATLSASCAGERLVLFANRMVVQLEPDGTLGDSIGSWRLDGQTLMFDVLNPQPTLWNDPTPQDAVSRETFTLIDWSSDQFTVSDRPGSTVTLQRCN